MSLRCYIAAAVRIARPVLLRGLSSVTRVRPTIAQPRHSLFAAIGVRPHLTTYRATPEIFKKWQSTTPKQQVTTPGFPSPSEGGSFDEFRISSAIQQRLTRQGITSLFPVQQQTYKAVFEGRDIICRAKTGSGKTLAFTLPIVEKLLAEQTAQKTQARSTPRCLVLTPTRELAKQVSGVFSSICRPNLRIATIYGGTSYNIQESILRSGTDIIVGTPGRIEDWLKRTDDVLDLSKVQFCVLDEADEMLRIGFAKAVEFILSKTAPPSNRQTCLWSATVPEWVTDVARRYMRTPELIDLVSSANQTPVEVNHLAIPVSATTRNAVLMDLILHHQKTCKRMLVFCQTKLEARNLSADFRSAGLSVRELHGDMTQASRERTMAEFRSGSTRVLIATDVAARGLDVPEVDMVIMHSPPSYDEAYVHRAGRTGRAGRAGTSMLLYEPDTEAYRLHDIQRSTGVKFSVATPPPPAATANRSWLHSLPQHGTVLLQTTQPDKTLTKNEAIAALKQAAEEVLGDVANAYAVVMNSLRMTEDGQGAVVDIHSSFVVALKHKSPQLSGLKLSVVTTTLPPLVPASVEPLQSMKPGSSMSVRRHSYDRQTTNTTANFNRDRYPRTGGMQRPRSRQFEERRPRQDRSNRSFENDFFRMPEMTSLSLNTH